ncbi:Uroporphyrinogen-III synthase [Cyclonatronum proteinivorum]|uniref:Uroporphyrinogen-III synthase n=1 Tax=Cyclonatronum proteinivorum TaxID=1457365 RepID=A0A345UNK7_9BACT|nr:uroporphyrinogen-III synthase [Cyclonatronum proteinivorum]AXJ02059.1 Uroporphyrinogen-III synthase [Cyclonatronum proteinivorum]
MAQLPVRVWFTRALSEAEITQAAALGIQAETEPLTALSFFSGDEIRARCSSLPKPAAFLFTSRNAVEAFLPVQRHISLPPLIFAVGARTAQRLAEAGIQAQQPAADAQHGTATGRLMATRLKPGENVWHFAAAQPRPEAREILQAAGIRYYHISCYRAQALRPANIPENLNALAFYSPGAVQAWQQLPGSPGAALPAFAIGSTTAQALREARFNPVLEAAEPSTAHIIRAIHHYFNQ